MSAAGFLKSIRGVLTFERTLALIFLISLVVRLAFLDLKLFHHDEAIHAWFSWRLLTEGVYQYDPSYHGPVLYYVTAGVFSVLGDSDLVGRLVPAVLGALLIPLLVPIYRLGYLNRRQTLVAALFLALSPELVYFSRFLRNDIFIVFFTLLLLVALLLYFEHGKARYAVLAGIAAAIGLATKENMPIVLAIFGLYLIWLVASKRVVLPRRWPFHLIAGAACAGIILVALYSSFFQHPEIALTWWYDAVTHWWEMHSIERIAGPPYFYVLLLLLYDAPLFLLAVYGTAQFIIKKRPQPEEPPRKSIAELAAISLAQLRGEVTGTVKGVASSPSVRNYEFTRFCIVWMLASMAAYAYIGEKVPWLVIHQILPMIFVAVYCLSDKKIIWVGVAVVFCVLMTAHVAFTPTDINEPIVQVQNSEELREVMALIDASNSSTIVTGEYWPLPWYYRGDNSNKIVYLVNQTDTAYLSAQGYEVIIAHDGQNLGEIGGYEHRKYHFRYWFSTYDNLDRIPQYYVLRDGVMGYFTMDVYLKENTSVTAIG